MKWIFGHSSDIGSFREGSGTPGGYVLATPTRAPAG
jgi:hypothetical protein